VFVRASPFFLRSASFPSWASLPFRQLAILISGSFPERVSAPTAMTARLTRLPDPPRPACFAVPFFYRLAVCSLLPSGYPLLVFPLRSARAGDHGKAEGAMDVSLKKVVSSRQAMISFWRLAVRQVRLSHLTSAFRAALKSLLHSNLPLVWLSFQDV
jgi:hypothetical protein